MRPDPLLALALIPLLGSGCAPAGVPRDQPLDWHLEPRWIIGGADNRQVALSELARFQVAADSSAVYILDHPGARVFVVSRDGLVTDTLGRHGGGPGEFEDPWALAPLHGGGVGVVDLGARHLARWSPDLHPGDVVPIRGAMDHPQLAVIGSQLLFVVNGQGADGRNQYQLIADGPARSDTLARLVKPERRFGDLPTCDARHISLVPLFTPTLRWSERDGLLAVADGAEYRVRLLRDGAQVAELTRPLPPIRATEAFAESAAADWRFNSCLVPPAEVVRATGYLPVIPVIEEVAIGPDGIVWVLRRGSDRSGPRIDLFQASGAYLGTLPPSTPFPAAFLDRDHLITVEADTDEVPRVTLYRLVRSRRGVPPDSSG